MLTVATITIVHSLELRELRKRSFFFFNLRQGELQDLCDLIIQLFNFTDKGPKAESSQTTSRSSTRPRSS